MRLTTKLLPAAAALLLLAGLTACSGGSTSTAGGGDASASSAASASASTSAADGSSDAAAGAVDLCALIPAAELTAALGADVGAGVASSQNGLEQCTWTQADGTSALAQYTDQPDVYLPPDIVSRSETAVDIDGATRGWADAEYRTVFVVKDGQGIMLNDFLFGTTPGDQTAWSALGAAIAANL